MKAIKFSFLVLFVSCTSYQRPVVKVRDTLMSKIETYRQCYHESDSYTGKIHLKKTGIMKIWLNVIDDGSVQESKILESDFQDPNFKACIMGVGKKLRFDPLPKGTTLAISQPLTFEPGQE